jgi:ParB-like chromosome segregation protein Spo0J
MSSKGASATSRKSVQDARKNLTNFLKQLDTVPKEELEASAQRIKTEAIAKVPYRTGKLERSIYVRVSKDKKRPGIVAGASARSKGGYNYAGIQHENENYYHAKGQAHFISEPFNAEVARLKRRIRRRLKLKRGS